MTYPRKLLEGERYREAVEGCVRIMKEEEGIA